MSIGGWFNDLFTASSSTNSNSNSNSNSGYPNQTQSANVNEQGAVTPVGGTVAPTGKDLNAPANLNPNSPTTATISNNDPANVPAKTPIDQLTELMQTATKPPSNERDAFFQPDPDQLKKVVASINTLEGISPELMQKAQSGDGSAFMEVMQKMQQNSMTGMLHMANKLVEVGAQHTADKLSKSLPISIARQTATDSILADNPYAAPFAALIVNGLQQSNPNQSPNQLQQQANDLLTKFVETAMQHKASKEPAQPQDQNNPAGNDTDFMKVLFG